MKELIDTQSQLIIRNFTDEELKSNIKLQEIVNSWSDDEAIKEYITSNCIWGNTLFSHLYGLNNILNSDDPNFSELYFAFDSNEQLQAVAQISKTKSKFNQAIQFIAVNPNTQSQGIGTRLVTSIINHPEYFNNNKHALFICAASETENIRSRKLLKKHHFIPYKKPKKSTLILYIRLWKSKEMGE